MTDVVDARRENHPRALFPGSVPRPTKQINFISSLLKAKIAFILPTSEGKMGLFQPAVGMEAPSPQLKNKSHYKSDDSGIVLSQSQTHAIPPPYDSSEDSEEKRSPLFLDQYSSQEKAHRKGNRRNQRRNRNNNNNNCNQRPTFLPLMGQHDSIQASPDQVKKPRKFATLDQQNLLKSNLDNSYQVLNFEQVLRLHKVMTSEISIHSRVVGFPTIRLTLVDFFIRLKCSLKEAGIPVNDVRINGGLASYVIG
ncbi:Family with sequence similarity 46, member [Cichlidogyrus casuarinus]|uniref:polynucleotide adenylyltransferase n=1 Tax=Cichlidogyrus casuarinus TaxID=1844966 RepID=A0ABD2QJ62_9PLAT